MVFLALQFTQGFASAQGFWLTWVGLFCQYWKARKGLQLRSFLPAEEHSSENCPQTFLLGSFDLRHYIKKTLLLFLLFRILFFISVALASPGRIATFSVSCSWPPVGLRSLPAFGLMLFPIVKPRVSVGISAFFRQEKWKPKSRLLGRISGVHLHCQTGSLLCSALGRAHWANTAAHAGSLLQSAYNFLLNKHCVSSGDR